MLASDPFLAIYPSLQRLEWALCLLDGALAQRPDELYLDPVLTLICYARQVVKIFKESA